MRHQYRDIAFRPDTLALIEQANAFIEEYGGQKLTLRQVYYRFVAADLIPNTEKSYKRIGSILSDARYAGLVDWDAIEDRGREPDSPAEWSGLPSLVESALRAYRLPRWADQGCHVELWVEKAALAGVLAPIAREHHVTLMVNRGYGSASSMKESADRMRHACGFDTEEYAEWETWMNDLDTGAVDYMERFEEGKRKLVAGLKQCQVLYLGDHDPSGEDMVRDVEARLREFGVAWLRVRKLALTMEQIKKFNPPPNPTKVSDSRAAAYIEKFGHECWELDALPPDELARLVRSAIGQLVDRSRLKAIRAREEDDKRLLREAVKNLGR